MDYKNPAEPGWQEAARWLQRQAKLFRKQKLTDKRYRIMREVLGAAPTWCIGDLWLMQSAL